MATEKKISEVELLEEITSETNLVCETGGGWNRFSLEKLQELMKSESTYEEIFYQSNIQESTWYDISIPDDTIELLIESTLVNDTEFIDTVILTKDKVNAILNNDAMYGVSNGTYAYDTSFYYSYCKISKTQLGVMNVFKGTNWNNNVNIKVYAKRAKVVNSASLIEIQNTISDLNTKLADGAIEIKLITFTTGADINTEYTYALPDDWYFWNTTTLSLQIIVGDALRDALHGGVAETYYTGQYKLLDSNATNKNAFALICKWR